MDNLLLPEQHGDVLKSTIDRLTVLIQAAHDTDANVRGQPRDVHGSWEMKLLSEEATYQRKITVGMDPEHLQLAWVTKPLWVLVKNVTDWEGALMPTPDQQKDVDTRCVLMGPPEKPDLQAIPPGCSLPWLYPQMPLVIRCVHAEAKLEIFAINQ